jgi:hypothetical protein
MGGPIIIWPPDVCSDFPGCFAQASEWCFAQYGGGLYSGANGSGCYCYWNC